MANLRSWIVELADGENILAVALGADPNTYHRELDIETGFYSWHAAQERLSREFDDGYGSPGCPAVIAWTENWIISVSQYDGSTRPFRIPRHPVYHDPVMPGA